MKNNERRGRSHGRKAKFEANLAMTENQKEAMKKQRVFWLNIVTAVLAVTGFIPFLLTAKTMTWDTPGEIVMNSIVYASMVGFFTLFLYTMELNVPEEKEEAKAETEAVSAK